MDPARRCCASSASLATKSSAARSHMHHSTSRQGSSDRSSWGALTHLSHELHSNVEVQLALGGNVLLLLAGLAWLRGHMGIGHREVHVGSLQASLQAVQPQAVMAASQQHLSETNKSFGIPLCGLASGGIHVSFHGCTMICEQLAMGSTPLQTCIQRQCSSISHMLEPRQ